MNIPATEPIYTTQYTNFKGVDFTSTIPDRSRFPIGKNFVIADDVHKRNGYELYDEYPGRINGIYRFTLRNKEYEVVHAGDKLYSNGNEVATVADTKSSGFLANDKYVIQTGKEFICFTFTKLNDYIKTARIDLSEAVEEFRYDVGTRDINYVSLANGTELEWGKDFDVSGYSQSSNNRVIVFTDEKYKGESFKVRFHGKSSDQYFTASADKWGRLYKLSKLDEEFKILAPLNPMKGDSEQATSEQIEGAYYTRPSYDQNTDYAFIPGSYKGKYAWLPYISTTKAEKDDDSRYYFGVYKLSSEDFSPSLYDYLSAVYVPTIRKRVTPQSLSEVDEGKFAEGWGDATGETYNLLNPYVKYTVDSIKGNDDAYGSNHYILINDSDDDINEVWALLSDGSLVPGDTRYSGGYESAYFSKSILGTNAGKPAEIIIKTKKSEKLIEEVSVFEAKTHGYLQYGNGGYHFYANIPKHPNRDYHSELENPLYVRADSYTIYGSSDNILGYAPYGTALAVIKEGYNDTNIYLRRAEYNSELGVTFPMAVGVGGATPGISADSIRNLNGEVLYLTNDGVYAVTSLSATDFNVTRKRSFYIDGKLTDEPGLKEATTCIWGNRYLIGINGNVYILDGTQPKDYIEGTNNEYSYECLFWDNIPARIFFSYGEELYFGTEDGKICKFNDGYEDNGKPVELVVATRMDDDGDFMSLKRLKKKGSGIMVKPFSRSCFDIAYRYDDYVELPVKKAYADIFDFASIDFSRFTFNASEAPRVIPFLKKSKKYKAMQILFRSVENEPFSLLGIIKRYTINNYVKK